jgi:hypothetical protein
VRRVVENGTDAPACGLSFASIAQVRYCSEYLPRRRQGWRSGWDTSDSECGRSQPWPGRGGQDCGQLRRLQASASLRKHRCPLLVRQSSTAFKDGPSSESLVFKWEGTEENGAMLFFFSYIFFPVNKAYIQATRYKHTSIQAYKSGAYMRQR